MKNSFLLIVILVIAVGVLMEARYTIIADSPIVAKLDRLTGDVYIANAGMWRKVEDEPMAKKEGVPPARMAQPGSK